MTKRCDMLWANSPLSVKVVTRRIALDLPPGAMLQSLANRHDAVMLESSALHETHGRYSILACRPLEVITLREGRLSDQNGNLIAAGDDALWSALDSVLTSIRTEDTHHDVGYLPGWIGYVGYEVGRHIEHLPGRAVRDTHLPDLRLGFYDALLVYDAIERSWQLVELVFDCPSEQVGCGARALMEVVADARGDRDEFTPAHVEAADASQRPAIRDAESNFTPEQYRRAVAKCIEYIAAGDIFQACLSQRFTIRGENDPAKIYRALRKRNPAWYSAYLAFQADGHDCAILSSSPELFIRLRDGHVTTRPIKGTRPRVGKDSTDRQAAADLLASQKDNAELAMIIDLLRNDLGRICRYGSVGVTEPCRLETHPTVFHLVGTVEGDLRENVGPAELLRATFPGGSITGAPKIRAMEIIDELEGVARGVYTGCIGHVGVDGSCEWNIVIRTIIRDDDKLHLQVGGGIVADSSPDGEYNETLDKARAMLEAIAQMQGVGHRA